MKTINDYTNEILTEVETLIWNKEFNYNKLEILLRQLVLQAEIELLKKMGVEK